MEKGTHSHGMTQHRPPNSDSTNSFNLERIPKNRHDGTFAFFHMPRSCQGSRGISAGQLNEYCAVQDIPSAINSTTKTSTKGVERAPALHVFPVLGAVGELVSPKSHKPIASVRRHVFVPYFAVAFL